MNPIYTTSLKPCSPPDLLSGVCVSGGCWGNWKGDCIPDVQQEAEQKSSARGGPQLM